MAGARHNSVTALSELYTAVIGFALSRPLVLAPRPWALVPLVSRYIKA